MDPKSISEGATLVGARTSARRWNAQIRPALLAIVGLLATVAGCAQDFSSSRELLTGPYLRPRPSGHEVVTFSTALPGALNNLARNCSNLPTRVQAGTTRINLEQNCSSREAAENVRAASGMLSSRVPIYEAIFDRQDFAFEIQDALRGPLTEGLEHHYYDYIRLVRDSYGDGWGVCEIQANVEFVPSPDIRIESMTTGWGEVGGRPALQILMRFNRDAPLGRVAFSGGIACRGIAFDLLRNAYGDALNWILAGMNASVPRGRVNAFLETGEIQIDLVLREARGEIEVRPRAGLRISGLDSRDTVTLGDDRLTLGQIAELFGITPQSLVPGADAAIRSAVENSGLIAQFATFLNSSRNPDHQLCDLSLVRDPPNGGNIRGIEIHTAEPDLSCARPSPPRSPLPIPIPPPILPIPSPDPLPF